MYQVYTMHKTESTPKVSRCSRKGSSDLAVLSKFILELNRFCV